MVRVRMTYLLATLALMVGFPCLVGVLMPTPSARDTWIVLFAASGVAALLLGLEARRDSYAFAQFAIVALLLPATFSIAAYIVAESDAGRVRAIAGGAASVVLMGFAAAKLWREHGAKDEAPNVLLERFARDQIFEIEGVQWSCLQGHAEVVDGTWVDIFVQNCVAAERTVTIALEDVTGLFRQRGSLVTPPLDPVHLAPGEVGKVRVPVRPGPRPSRDALLYVSVRARGPAGHRLRKLRARAASERTRFGFQLFALLGGHIVWGGGVRFAFTNANEIASRGDASERATWESIWRGDAEALP